MSTDPASWLCDVANACQAAAVESMQNRNDAIRKILLALRSSPPFGTPVVAAVAHAVVLNTLARACRIGNSQNSHVFGLQKLALAQNPAELANGLSSFLDDAGSFSITPSSTMARTPTDLRVNRAVQYVFEHVYSRGLCVSQVCGHVGLSPSHLNRLFARDMGVGVRTFIRHTRLESARRSLMEQSLSVKEVCFGHGYATLSAFCRDFRAMFGRTPGAIRQRRDFRTHLDNR